MKKRFEYFIPAIAVALVTAKRATDPRCPHAPPLQDAYEEILKQGLISMKVDPDFAALVKSCLFRIDTDNAEVWHKINLPIFEALHVDLRERAKSWGVRLYDLTHAIFILCTPSLDYADVTKTKTLTA